jgi:hypothetical protein
MGHVSPASVRRAVLEELARLLAPEGRIFLDVNHRYNFRHYGLLPTCARFLKDRIAGGEGAGDVVVGWKIDGGRCETYGHVFTHGEIVALCRNAGLSVASRTVLDYSTGVHRRWSGWGHLVYELRR